MTQINWAEHPEFDRKLLAIKAGTVADAGIESGVKLKFRAGLSGADIARRLNAYFDTDIFTKDAINSRLKVAQPPRTFVDYPPPQPTPYFSEHFDEAGRLLKPAAPKMDFARRLCELESSNRWVKTLVLSDTQGVMWDADLTERAISAHPDADIVMVPGDVADWEGASKYTHERDFPLLFESDWLVRFYTVLSERYPHAPIIVTNSNHRRRVEKAIRTLPQGLLFLAEHNPERYLAQPFRNITAIEPWYQQIGDTIYAHKEGKTAGAGDNVKSAINTFRSWRDSRQFPVNEFRCVVTGHSHKLATLFELGILGIEPGCLAKLPMQYMTTAEITTVQENGYAVVYQKAGRVSLEESRGIYLGNG